MSIELTRDAKSGRWSLSFQRHIFVALGLLFVGSGLAIFSGPWWQGILVALLVKVNVVVNDAYQWVIGGTQVLAGLALLAYKHFIVDQRQVKIAADKRTLSTGDLQIDLVGLYLLSLVDDHSYRSSLDSAFHESFTRFLKPEFSLQLPETAASYKNYSNSAAALHQFVHMNFFVFPNEHPGDGDYRYCLAPDLNFDRGMSVYDSRKVAEYDELNSQLHAHMSATKYAFDHFVEHLKCLGHV